MSLPIQIVDESDQPSGVATKQQAWEQGLLHRVVRIMLFDTSGRVLLQHRDPSKDIFPNCWDNSIAGHVDAGEDYDTTAQREANEELGLADLVLTKVFDYRSDETIAGRRFNRFTTVYTATISGTPNKLEVGKVDAVRWFTPDEVVSLVRDHPDQVTDGLRQVAVRML